MSAANKAEPDATSKTYNYIMYIVITIGKVNQTVIEPVHNVGTNLHTHVHQPIGCKTKHIRNVSNNVGQYTMVVPLFQIDNNQFDFAWLVLL